MIKNSTSAISGSVIMESKCTSSAIVKLLRLCSSVVRSVIFAKAVYISNGRSKTIVSAAAGGGAVVVPESGSAVVTSIDEPDVDGGDDVDGPAVVLSALVRVPGSGSGSPTNAVVPPPHAQHASDASTPLTA